MDAGTGPAAGVRTAPPLPRRSPRPPGHRRWWLLGAGVALLILGGLGGLSVAPAGEARTALEDGREALERARSLLTAGEIEAADEAFAAADADFARAVDTARSFPLGVVGGIPFVGRSVGTATAIAEAGERIATAGRTITGAILDLPGGVAALGPHDGRISPEPFRALAPALAEAATFVRQARRMVEDAPGTLVLSEIGAARTEVLAELDELERTLDTAEGLLGNLDVVLGVDDPARFLVGAQNPAELRGTGGLVGAFSILTVADGRFRFSDFRPIQDLPTYEPDEITAPDPEYAQHYDRFGGAGFWLNANMTPHYPWAAEAMSTTYLQGTGERLDGVILADPFAIAELLEFTGPLTLEGVGRVDARSVVALVTNEAYRRFDDQGVRKLVLGNVALEVFRRFLNEAEADVEWVRTLVEAAAGGHILVWSDDAGLQEVLAETGAAGALTPPAGGDFLSLVQNNGGGNKLDFYLERSLTYEVKLGSAGTAEATATIELRNHAPDSGVPRYVIGPYPGVSRAGENVSFVTLYCAETCRLRSAERDGETAELYGGSEAGARFFQDYVKIPSGETTTSVLRLALTEVWAPDGSGGVYRLTYLGQPTIQPTSVTVRVAPPPGGRIVEGSDGVRVEDGLASWTGTPGRRLEIVVRFEL